MKSLKESQMNKMSLYSILGLSLLSVACSKSPILTTDLSDGDSSLSIKCKTQTGPVDPAQLQIEGATVAQAGQKLSYKLNEDLSCSSSQKVVWKTVAAQDSLKVGSVMNSSFQKAGTFVVAAQVQSVNQPTTELSFKTVVVGSQVALSGPQVGMVGSLLTFDVGIPVGLVLTSADWNFGDGSAVINSLNAVTHTYSRPGIYTVSLTTVDSNQVSSTLTQQVTIVPLQDGYECVGDTAISSPSVATVNVPVTMSAYIPTCLTNKVTAISWRFGDNQTASNQTVTHTYMATGDQVITVQLFINGSTTPWVSLTQTIHVSAASPEPTPTPAPTPVPTPTPIDPLACSPLGGTRQSEGELFSETAACGVNGTKILSYRNITTETCQLTGEVLLWTQTKTEKHLVSEGACQGQSCTLSDGSILADGAKKTLYANQTPAGTCTSVSEDRTCNNAVLSGTPTVTQLVCHNACDGFGAHGTVKTGIVTGTENVAMTCAFGETGIFSIFTQTSTQTCVDGAVQSSNTQRGTLQTAGVCPGYHWAPTEAFTACSADCGGTQSRIYDCRNDKNELSPSERCPAVKPHEERLCDGNPAAVAHQDSTVTQENGNSSNLCPADQIGIVTNERDVTTVKVYACVDHKVQQTDTKVTYGAWATQSYCRDYVARRCSQDSLDNHSAAGRLAWMKKCQNQVPVIKEFLTKFARVDADGEFTLNSERHLYPTFMNTATDPEEPWIAPVSKRGSCQVPSTVYIATVCVSSCATPEEQIMVDEAHNQKAKYVPFIDALTKNYKYVATLQNMNTMQTDRVHISRVDQWITELIDTEHDILVFKMKSGGQLKVTPNHPLLGSDGMMRRADTFKAGENLVQIGGHADAIVSIDNIKYFGKVYNLFVKSSDVAQNIVITNGYLNGTAYFQNEGTKGLNRTLFRNKLTKGALGQ